MRPATQHELAAIRSRRCALARAIERKRSAKWLLRLWSSFIKTRDGFRCICCNSNEKIQAHHIVRRTLFPPASVDPGNGITLCRDCHRRVHAEFNGKPHLSRPIGAEQGDDQNEWSFLFGLLVEDAHNRRLPEGEFYHLGDRLMEFSVACQGYEELYESVRRGTTSRVRFAHEIWRGMPEQFYTRLASDLALRYLMPCEADW